MTAIANQKLELREACVKEVLAIYDRYSANKKRKLLEITLYLVAGKLTRRELADWKLRLAGRAAAKEKPHGLSTQKRIS